MKHLQLSIDTLDDAPRNANRLTPEKYAGLVESIRRIGFVCPIIVGPPTSGRLDARREIVDGHHRRRAVREIGGTIIDAVELEPGEDPRLVALALNRLRGETDLSIAGLVVDELMSIDGFSAEQMVISGFSERELADLVDALNQPDDVDLGDVGGASPPEEVGVDVLRPFLLELTFRSKADLAIVRKALRKAAGKGADLGDGLLRLTRGE